MSESIKRIYNLGIGKETSRGTAVAPSFWLKTLNHDVQDRTEVVKSERQFGRIEGVEDQEIAKTWSDGAIEGEIMDKSIGLILLSALGSVSSAESADSGVYNHTYSILQSSQHPSLTIVEKRNDIEQVAYVNSVIESLGLSFELNNYATFSANVKGKGKTADTSTPSYIEENTFMAKNVSVSLADDYSSLDSGTSVCAKNLSLEIAKDVQDDECLGNSEPTDFLNQEVRITGEIELYFDSIYSRDYALNNTTKAMRIELENSDVVIGSVSNPKIIIDLAKVKFESPELSSAPNEIVRLTLAFEAFYSQDDELAINVVLTNTQASY